MHDKMIINKPLTLASSSKARAKVMHALGLDFTIEPSTIDESSYKATTKDPNQLVLVLANAKAQQISMNNPHHYVIACDQVCYFEDHILSKPLNSDNAINQLRMLSGKKHRLINGICIWHDNKMLWQSIDCVTLTMRRLSTDAIVQYVNLDKPYYSCGGYYYELHGKLLFEHIEGLDDSILGLPSTLLLNNLLCLEICQFSTGKLDNE
jgi:nucleoside triphosphate pyrophosphatase